MGQKKSKHDVERAAAQQSGSGNPDPLKSTHRQKLEAKSILSTQKSKHHISPVYSNNILFSPLDLFNYTITQPVEIITDSEDHPPNHEDILLGILRMAFPEGHPFCSKTDDGDSYFGHRGPDERLSAHEIAEVVIAHSEALQWMMSNFNVDLSEKGSESDITDMYVKVMQDLCEHANEAGQRLVSGVDFAKSLLTRQQFVSFRKNVPDHVQLPDIYDYELGMLYEMSKVLQTQIRYRGEHKNKLTVYSDEISRSASVVCEPDLVFLNELSTANGSPAQQCLPYSSGITVKVHNPRKHVMSPARSLSYNKSIASVGSSHDTGIDLTMEYHHGGVNIPQKYSNLPEKLISALCDSVDAMEASSNSILHEPEQNYLSLVHDLQQHVLELLSAAQEHSEEVGRDYSDTVYTLGLFVHNDDIYVTRLVSNHARLLLCTARDAEHFWKQRMRIPLKHTAGYNKSYPLVTFSKEPLNLRVPAHRMGLMVFLKYYNSMVNLSL